MNIPEKAEGGLLTTEDKAACWDKLTAMLILCVRDREAMQIGWRDNGSIGVLMPDEIGYEGDSAEEAVTRAYAGEVAR